jgi:hypothetical protein
MLHTNAIKTMYDNVHLDTLHFGNFIKTYLIPCKYDDNNPYISNNNEYFLLFYIPSMHNQLLFKDTLNKNIEKFIQQFKSDYV